MTRRHISPAIRAAEWAAVLENQHDVISDAKVIAASLRGHHELMVRALRTIRDSHFGTDELPESAVIRFIYIAAETLKAIGDDDAQPTA